MKKFILLAALGNAILFSAQTHFGVKAGYNLTNMKLASYKLDSKSYFYAGAFAEHQLSSKFSLQGEIIYTELGGSFQQDFTHIVEGEIINIENAEYKYHYPQIQVPVSAKYYFEEKFSVQGGFNFGFNLNPTLKADENSGLPSGKVQNVKTVNISPFAGAEYRITDHFSVDARYNFGISNLHDNGFKMKAGFLQVGLGYRFK